MGKPQDQQDAMRMLMLLSGGENNVYTGVTVIHGKTGRVDTRCDQTRVHFVSITPEAAQRYIDSGEPMDKAGAYGAQGMGSMFVSAIEGSPSNVIGLPIHLVRQMLMEIGWQL
ncbi:MAG: Maf family protein [Christensenellales bacterium]